MKVQSQEISLYQRGQADQTAPDARRAGMVLLASGQPVTHLADPACHLLGTGRFFCHRAGGPSAQDTPLFFFQDWGARGVRLLPTHPGQSVNPPGHHQINSQARLQTFCIIQAPILDAAPTLQRAVMARAGD